MGENRVLTPAKGGARCDSRLCQNFANIQIFVVQIKSRSSQMMVSEIPRHQTAWIFPGTLQPGKGQRAGRPSNHTIEGTLNAEQPPTAQTRSRNAFSPETVSPPQAPILGIFLRFFTCFHGNSAYLRPCYHALRQPVGAADRAMMHN